MSMDLSQRADDVVEVVVEPIPYRSLLFIAALTGFALLLKAGDWPRLLSGQVVAVQVVRRADGRVLARYDYRSPSDAQFHAHALRGRVSSWDVGDLCAHLGISRFAALNDGSQVAD